MDGLEGIRCQQQPSTRLARLGEMTCGALCSSLLAVHEMAGPDEGLYDSCIVAFPEGST